MSSTSPTTSPPELPSPGSSASHAALPPLITSPPNRRSTIPRPMSHVSKHRLSQYSTGSGPSRSRPVSHMFPIYPSSLPYTSVRDFAYPPAHQLHYGPPPEPSRPPSGMTTPASEHRRLSDPSTWEGKSGWDAGGWTYNSKYAGDIPPIHLGDGPPWSEDEDLQSPVVSSRHRKHKSSGSFGRHHHHHHHHRHGGSTVMDPANYDPERGYYVDTSENGGDRYYVNQGDEANGPGGEFVTYPADQARHSNIPFQPHDQSRQYDQAGYGSDASSCSSPGYGNEDQSRYSRDYQFTITSPDEEMHGKAVALYDFERESENELPLVEGQIILISYRHGEGWLVAQDPKTQESGLVPEAYVRLLRDIEGGMNSLSSALGEGSTSPNDVSTPTQAEHGPYGHTPTTSSVSNGYHQPVVSTFSTSSRDFDPYPTGALGAGQTPPQVVHYHGQRGGSQANTPTLLSHHDMGMRRGSTDAVRRGSQDVKRGSDAMMTPVPETLQNMKMNETKQETKEETKEAQDGDAMDTDR